MRAIFIPFILGLMSVSFPLHGSESLKVVSFNIYMKPDPFNSAHSNERIAAICQMLKDPKHPHNRGWDVVLIQEAWTIGTRKALKKCGYPHIADLGVKGKIHRKRRAGIRIPVNRKGIELNLDSGLMILSKHPFIQKKRHNFSVNGKLTRIFSDGEALVAKSLYLVKIKHPKIGGIWLANTHLAANYCLTTDRSHCQSYEEQRKIQLGEVARYLNHLAKNHPVILGGDLNMGPHAIARDKIWDRLDRVLPGFDQGKHDATLHTTDERNTFNDHSHGKLDHLFGSTHFKVQNAGLCLTETIPLDDKSKTNYSDHYGWQAEFVLKK